MACSEKLQLRSKLAQSVYDKMVMDEKLKIMDFSMWYKVRETFLTPEARSLFLQMDVDSSTRKFIDTCFENSDHVFLQIWHSIAKSFLGLFMSQTSINGLLNRGRMFVWSREQARLLLGESNYNESNPRHQSITIEDDVDHQHHPYYSAPLTPDTDHHAPIRHESPCEGGGAASRYPFHADSPANQVGANEEEEETFLDAVADFKNSKCVLRVQRSERPFLNQGDNKALSGPDDRAGEPQSDWWANKVALDLGAGDGHVTEILSDSAAQIYVTEASLVMRRRLGEKGYKILSTDGWAEEISDGYFDLITCLNLLDRCDQPVSLLKDIHRKLSPDGRLVVAVVLPLSPYVETGTADHEPSETLGVYGDLIEEQVNCLIEQVFPKLGFKTLRWTRLPYLCEGDMDQAFYWLSDLVFILRKSEDDS